MKVITIVLILGLALYFFIKRKNKPERYILRQGKATKTDAVFKAWTSGNLKKMLNVLNVKTNPIDRHYLLQGIVNETYKLRQQGKMKEKCKEISLLHLTEFSELQEPLKKENDGWLPRVTTFQHYSTILSDEGNYEKAIKICKEAIAYGLHDNTKSGFEGRIKRIERKLERTTS
jgi:hypothetical protein